MSTQLLQIEITKVYPAKKEVIKRRTDEYVEFSCEFSAETDFAVEVWTNISGRFRGHEMQRDGCTYHLHLPCTDTGFFKATMRWRSPHHEYWNWLINVHHEEEFSEIHVDPAYITNSIVYNAFIRFFGQEELSKIGIANYGHSGSFDDLKKKLRELKKMGVDIIYLNPIHPIGELYRNYNPHDLYPKYMQPGCPYSIKDYKAIDPELGVDKDHSQGPHASLADPLAEFRDVVRAAHKLGIKIFMDLVFNHTSHDFVLQRLHPEWFLYKENIKSLEDPYLYPDDIKEGKPWGDSAHTLCPFDHGYWWEDAAQLNWEYQLPAGVNTPPKNPTIKEMYAYFKSIPQYWIKRVGIDGFRCDVAYRIPKDFWKACIHEAREFAKEEHRKHKSITGDVVFIAESYVDDVEELFKAGFTAVYGDYSNKLYTVQTLKGYLDYMYNISGQFFPEHALFFIFPECHDFIRNTHKLLGHVKDDALLSERANQSRWILTATLPGIPMIFNGFEKLEWHPINLFSYSKIDWESDKDLKKFIIKVNAIRNTHPALQNGNYTYVPTMQDIDHAQIFSFLRKKDDECMLISVNMNIYAQSTETLLLDENISNVIGIDFSKKYVLKDLLDNKEYVREENHLTIVLEAGKSHIFKVEKYPENTTPNKNQK